MAVRTKMAGVKNKRRVASADEAQPNVQASNGRKTLPRDEAAALRRTKNLSRVTLGPAAETHEPKSNTRRRTSLNGRKKAPSEMAIKHRGGPRNRARLHGG